MWKVDQVIGGRYVLRDRLGAGASAEVWRAFDAKLQALAAIKLLDPVFASTEVARRVLREAQAAARIRSLHVVQILDSGVEREVPYIVMELLEGETLAERLERTGALPARTASGVVTQIAKAAAKAHREGIVHRDLKPANVFLVADDDELVAKVIDFGIAKVKRSDAAAGTTTELTQAGSLLGTPEFMSPEQARGATVDFRADLYAIGVIAFQCFTGGLPFATDDVSEILQRAAAGELLRPSDVASVPTGFDAWFARATAYDREARFGSAREMAAALADLLFDED